MPVKVSVPGPILVNPNWTPLEVMEVIVPATVSVLSAKTVLIVAG